MAKKVHESYLKITGDNKSALASLDGISKKMGSAERSIRGFGNGISGTLGSVTGMFTSLPFLVSTAAIGVVGGLTSVVKSTIDTAEHIEKMSQRVGVSAESLSTLSYAAQLSGTDIGVFEKAIQRLSRNVDDASRGIGDGKKAFDYLNISVKDSEGRLRKAEAIMGDVADKFGDMEDGTKKTALALQIFGRAGADLIPMLNGGSKKLNEMQQQARDLGLEISTNTAKEAAEFKDEVLRLESSFKGVGVAISTGVLPYLNQFGDKLFENRGKITKFVTDSIKEFDVFFYLLNNPSIDNFAAFVSDGFDMKLPREELKATSEELENLKNGIQYIVDGDGNLVKIDIETDQEKAERVKKELEAAAEKTRLAKDEAEKLAKQWKATSSSLAKDIELAGLPKAYIEFVKIDQKVADLQSKFGNKQMITDWAESMKAALIDVNSITASLDPSQYAFYAGTTAVQQPIEFDRSAYDAQIAAITEVTDIELANLAIRQQGTLDTFSNMSQAALMFFQSNEKQHKGAFKLYKTFAVAETAIATYQAATEAYKSMVGIPIVGPGLAVAAAAAATAFGLARINAINSQTPGSGYSSLGAGSVTQPTTNYNSNTTNNSPSITINIQSSYKDPAAMVREDLIPEIEKHFKYGGTIKFG